MRANKLLDKKPLLFKGLNNIHLMSKTISENMLKKLQPLHQGSRIEWYYQPLAQGYTNSLLNIILY